jgi:hypothetical protein
MLVDILLTAILVVVLVTSILIWRLGTRLVVLEEESKRFQMKVESAILRASAEIVRAIEEEARRIGRNSDGR